MFSGSAFLDGRLSKLVEQRNDQKVFARIANAILGNQFDPKLMRLLLFTGLEGHDLTEMFFQNHVRPFLEFLTSYVKRRIEDGTFDWFRPYWQ